MAFSGLEETAALLAAGDPHAGDCVAGRCRRSRCVVVSELKLLRGLEARCVFNMFGY